MTEHPDPETRDAAHPPGLRRRWLLNASLLLFIGVLTWLVVQRVGQEKEPEGTPLTTLSAGDLLQLRLERPGQETIVLEKTADKWKLTAPVKARANAFNVDKLLRLLAAPAATRFPIAGHEPAKFGLEPPQATVAFGGEVVAFGSMHPLNNRIYVRYKDEIALIDGHYLASAIYPYTNFIDSRLFEAERKITAIKLPDFTLIQKDGAWQRQPPDKKLASDRINDFAAEWQNASALQVEKYSGKEILERIEITALLDGKSDKLVLGIIAYKPDFVLYRQDENLEYHFTEDTGKRLLSISLQ